MRERSVVRSSVMPSAKYSWSGAVDRLVNATTTIDGRGAGLAAVTGAGCPPVGAGAWTDTADKSPLGQTHKTAIAMPIAATVLAARIASRVLLRRLSATGCNGI